MKRTALLATLILCSAFTAADSLEQPHIIVYGKAEIKVTPNEMIWSVNVKNEDKELPTAAANHSTTVKQVLEFIKELEIDEKKLQTSRMHFGENWKRIDNKRTLVGYFASTDISFTITDFELYQKIWFGLAAMEGVSIQNTQYAHSDRISYQNQSREKAVLAAREKATNLARTLGVKIGDPLKIEEVSVQNYMWGLGVNNSNLAMEDPGVITSSEVLALGQISISTKVKTIFKLEK